MSAFIRGLWGNHLLARRAVRPPDAFAHVLRSVGRLRERDDHVDVFYCFGEDNRDYLKYLGFKDVRMINRHSWAGPKVVNAFHHRWDGAWVHGCSYWWHKLEIMIHALRHFSEVVWTDSDIRQVRPIPDDFWSYLRQGADFRASLYLQRNWTWGAGWRRTKKWGVKFMDPLVNNPRRAAQIVPGCGFLYLRSYDTALEAMSIQNEYPFWLDHQIYAYLLDRRYKKWIGEESYIAKGYHTDFYYYGRQLFPPDKERMVWQGGSRSSRIPR